MNIKHRSHATFVRPATFPRIVNPLAAAVNIDRFVMLLPIAIAVYCPRPHRSRGATGDLNCRRLKPSVVPNPRVQVRVQHVHHQVGHDEDARHEQHHRLHNHVVAGLYRLHRQ